MKKITLLSAASVVAIAGCSVPTGTLENQAAFGKASAITQTAQLADLTEYLKQLSAQFRANVPTTVNFEFNKSKLDAEARRVLDQQAAWIKQYPLIRFSVYGHTDLVGTESYNRRLGLRRAQAALNYLVSQGVSRRQLRAVTSRGESQPLISTPSAERLNRRTVTDVMGVANARRRGTGMDGKRALIVYNEYVTDAGSEVVAE